MAAISAELSQEAGAGGVDEDWYTGAAVVWYAWGRGPRMPGFDGARH